VLSEKKTGILQLSERAARAEKGKKEKGIRLGFGILNFR